MTTKELDTLKDLLDKFWKETPIDEATKRKIENSIFISRHLNGDEAVIKKHQQGQTNCKKLVI